MRITIDIDDDIARLIEEQIQRTGESFNAAVNRLLRLALAGTPPPRGPCESSS
jgi:negative regulator of replication initiation